MKAARLRAIPSVDKILQSLGETGLPAPVVVDAVRRHLKRCDRRRPFPPRRDRRGHPFGPATPACVAPYAGDQRTGSARPHQSGRAPLATDSIRALIGDRRQLQHPRIQPDRAAPAAAALRISNTCLAILCGAEAAAVVNNNAAALVLILDHFCAAESPEVVISRGELLQIGGGFRIPSCSRRAARGFAKSARPIRPARNDYARAISRHTALILKVHRSNFFMDGFVESPSTEDLAGLARSKRVPFVEDLGSGAIVADADCRWHGARADAGGSHPKRGVDLVCFSGDKLFGGPQAGIIVGRKRMIDALKREPLFRALRCDKLILSALEATVDTLLARRHAHSGPRDDAGRRTTSCASRAERIVAALDGRPLQPLAWASDARRSAAARCLAPRWRR